MPTIRIANRKLMAVEEPNVEYVNVMRPSPLSNPHVMWGRTAYQLMERYMHLTGNAPDFKMHINDLSREVVCEEFEVSFRRAVAQDGPEWQAVCEIIKHLEAGKDVTLVCCCAPKRCHAQTIATYIVETCAYGGLSVHYQYNSQ